MVLNLFGTSFQPRWEGDFPNVSFLQSLREQFVQGAIGLTPDSRGLVIGLTIGERSLISEDLANQMKQLSLTHLVAVSGANLAIVAATIYWLAGTLSLQRSLRFAMALFFVSCYVLLVGPEPSVLRAYVMTVAVLLSLWIGRGTHPVYALGWAVIVILISDPAMATNFGFALSVSATLGLLVLGRPLYERLEKRFPSWLALGVATAIAAQIYTLPIMLMLQPSIPAYATLANLLVEAMVAPVTVLGILSVIATLLFAPLTPILSLLASFGTAWIEQVTIALNRLPMLRLHWLPGWVGITVAICFAAFFTLYLTNQNPKRYLAASIFTVLFSISWITLDVFRYESWPNRDWDLVMCDVGQGDAFVIRADNQVAVVDVGREPEPINECLTELDITEIDLLFISHFDLDHVGGLSGALSNRKVQHVLVSGFQDDRPVVDEVNHSLKSSGVTSRIAQSGMRGSLGTAVWRVLAPSASAVEASDANDASIVLGFEFEQFSLLVLGDLGEVGQDRLLRLSKPQLVELNNKPLILKVSHHGSADQSRNLHELISPELNLVSAGAGNVYGHPTNKTLRMLERLGGQIVRTDLSGSIAIAVKARRFEVTATGKLAQ
ncbi:MAG: hypothetical protein RLZZ579_289 [Actinomycetota bacterium]